MAALAALGVLIAGAIDVYIDVACWPHAVRNTRSVIHVIREATVHYRTDHANACPPSLQAFVAEGYLTKLPRDEWGQPLEFISPGVHDPDDVDVSSAGRDRRFGTADDIRSWDM